MHLDEQQNDPFINDLASAAKQAQIAVRQALMSGDPMQMQQAEFQFNQVRQMLERTRGAIDKYK